MAERPFFSFHFHKQSHTPIYVQLADQLKTAILRGAFLVDGQQLISLRDMKTVSGCSLETVKKAYDHLALEGWLEAVHGKGYYLTTLAKEARLESRLPLTDIPIASLADSSPRPGEELVKRLRGAFYESLTVLDEPSAQKKSDGHRPPKYSPITCIGAACRIRPSAYCCSTAAPAASPFSRSAS
ncbi:GntR family transcriptional regulator [Brevibacillus gelatini]